MSKLQEGGGRRNGMGIQVLCACGDLDVNKRCFAVTDSLNPSASSTLLRLCPPLSLATERGGGLASFAPQASG
jgi:hypothetical protein